MGQARQKEQACLSASERGLSAGERHPQTPYHQHFVRRVGAARVVMRHHHLVDGILVDQNDNLLGLVGLWRREDMV